MHTRLDQAMKRLVRDLLGNSGTFTPDFEVSPDPQNVDGYFVPNPHHQSPIAETLLGRMTSAPCSLEFFSATPDIDEVTACVRKHLNLLHIFSNKDSTVIAPHQWIISSGMPDQAMAKCWVRHAKDWPRGVHALAPILATSIVVVNKLPENRSTLLL